MRKCGFKCGSFLVLASLSFLRPSPAWAQSSGSIEGAVKDPSGAAVPGATVDITYPVSGYSRTTTTRSDGGFRFTNVPFNPYHLVVKAAGFAPYTQDVDVRSSVPAVVQVSLQLGAVESTVTVEAMAATSSRTTRASTRTWIGASSTRSRWRASRLR